MDDAGPPAVEAEAPAARGDAKDLAALAGAFLGVVTAVVGGATVGGGLDRVSREQPVLVGIGLAALGLGMVFTAFGVLNRGVDPRGGGSGFLAHLRASMGAVFVLLGVALLLAAVVCTAGTRSRPAIDAAIRVESDDVYLDATVRANGLRASEYLRIKVERSEGEVVIEGLPPLYLATQGAGSSGAVEVSLSVILPPGPYDAVVIQVWQRAETPDPCPIDIGAAGSAGCMRVAVVGPGRG